MLLDQMRAAHNERVKTRLRQRTTLDLIAARERLRKAWTPQALYYWLMISRVLTERANQKEGEFYLGR